MGGSFKECCTYNANYVKKKEKKDSMSLPEMSTMSPSLGVTQEEDIGLGKMNLLDQGSLLMLIHSQFHASGSHRCRAASQAHSLLGD